MIMKARIKVTHFFKQFQTSLVNRLWKSFTYYVIARRSVCSHNFALRFFNNEIRKNIRQNVIQHFPCSLPVKNWSTECFFASPSISRIFRTSKSIFQPNNKAFITTCNFEHGMPLITRPVFPLFSMSDVEAPFSIHNTSKICKFGNRMFGFKKYFFRHVENIKDRMVVNVKLIHRERLNEKAA